MPATRPELIPFVLLPAIDSLTLRTVWRNVMLARKISVGNQRRSSFAVAQRIWLCAIARRKENSQGVFTAGMGAVGSNLEGLLLIDATAMVAITRTTMPRMTMFHMNTVSIRNYAVVL
jgi:hypothetical protein